MLYMDTAFVILSFRLAILFSNIHILALNIIMEKNTFSFIIHSYKSSHTSLHSLKTKNNPVNNDNVNSVDKNNDSIRIA